MFYVYSTFSVAQGKQDNKDTKVCLFSYFVRHDQALCRRSPQKRARFAFLYLGVWESEVAVEVMVNPLSYLGKTPISLTGLMERELVVVGDQVLSFRIHRFSSSEPDSPLQSGAWMIRVKPDVM